MERSTACSRDGEHGSPRIVLALMLIHVFSIPATKNPVNHPRAARKRLMPGGWLPLSKVDPESRKGAS
jgi:hypothetical protein